MAIRCSLDMSGLPNYMNTFKMDLPGINDDLYILSPYSTVNSVCVGYPMRTKRDKQHEIYMANRKILHWGPNATYIPLTCVGVIPCQFNQALPHFVLDFLYMLTICAKICLGNIFQVIASKI